MQPAAPSRSPRSAATPPHSSTSTPSSHPPRKRSRWEDAPLPRGGAGASSGSREEGKCDDVVEREAEMARAKAAAKAARQRLKEMKRRTQQDQQQQQQPEIAQVGAQEQEKEDEERRSTPPTISSVKAARPPPVPPRLAHPSIAGCRSVYAFERLNHIEEGSYGVVFRARDKQTGEIVALKRLKMDQEKNGFPITSLREIRTLMEARHPNVVQVKEIVVGDTLTQIYIVMEFVEHDLKTLLSNMRTSFFISEIKTLMHQLLSGVALLHANWIIHRDLKTSNLLMNNRGTMKLADFGLARMYGDPLDPDGMTSLVVTLWYRAPELLLGAKEYDTAIDMWSVGCVFAELMQREPLFTGKNEAEQLAKIFRLLGQPSEDSWPGFTKLPGAAASVKFAAQPFSTLRQRFSRQCTEAGIDLLQRLLTYDPKRRITAEEALSHSWFKESPAPAHPDTFGSFPSIAAGERRRDPSPNAPERAANREMGYQLELDI